MVPSTREALHIIETLVRFYKDGHSDTTLAFILKHELMHLEVARKATRSDYGL